MEAAKDPEYRIKALCDQGSIYACRYIFFLKQTMNLSNSWFMLSGETKRCLRENFEKRWI